MLFETIHETRNEHTEPRLHRKTQLEAEQRRINEEIKLYPHPIPACDAQFNYLLEERTRIAQELARLAAPAQTDLTPHNQ